MTTKIVVVLFVMIKSRITVIITIEVIVIIGHLNFEPDWDYFIMTCAVPAEI